MAIEPKITNSLNLSGISAENHLSNIDTNHGIVPNDLTDDLQDICVREEVGSLALLLTAFGILIYRYTRGEAELSIGISKTAEQESAHASPFFTPRIVELNQVLLALRDDMTLRQAIRHARKLLADAGPADTWSSLLSEIPSGDSVTLEFNEPGENAGTLTISLRSSEGLQCTFSLDRFLSMEESLIHVERHWFTLLSNLFCNLDTPISLLPIMDSRELEKVLAEWRGSEHDPDLCRRECLHHLFESQAEANPDRIALVCAGESLTYAELNEQADRLADQLRTEGVRTGSYVGIFMPRSIDLFVTMLATLKAGAAYVPIDPEYPADRVDYILSDCGVSALLTTSDLSKDLGISCPIIHMDEDWDLERPFDLTGEDREPTSDDPAYVIYTSGSTGRPKGVLIRHSNVCNFVRAEGRLFDIQPNDRVFQGFSVAFDASVEEMWLAFFAGATLVVGTHDMVHAGPSLAGILAEQGVTVLSCVPTLLSMMCEDIPSLRLLILGGEQCHQDLVARWWRPNLRIVNTYGPTEATVVATYADCIPGRPVTIGRPIPNYSAYVLDANLQPVPIGIPGELHIGGPGIAVGYLNRPDLTAEKFIPNPFLHGSPPYQGGVRGGSGTLAEDQVPTAPILYKTGDLVRYTAEGDIEFLGRIDAQVKLRGFRIELTEIESVLMQCPGVQTAVVSVREDIPGIEQLVAYIMEDERTGSDECELKSALRSRLPAYMVPSIFVRLDSFPTLASGKVDRKRLPAPECSLPDEETTQVEGRTETECAVLTVWMKLFYPQTVALTDNFFDLGGHSLLAARMVSELRKNPGMGDVSMLDVYHHPTLESFAKNIEDGICHQNDDAAADNKSANDFRVPKLQFVLCSAAQAVGAYAVLGVFLLPWLLSYRAYELTRVDHSTLVSLLAAFGAALVIFPAMAIASIAGKWIIIGRYKPGKYPVWGAYYWRFWMARRLQGIIPMTYLRGTPLLNIYCRLMGAKIGRNVYLGSHYQAAYDLLTIGDDSSIGLDAQITGYTIEDGMLTIGDVNIGERCFVGAKSVLHPDTVMCDDSLLEDQSMLPAGSAIPRGETWRGSPASAVPLLNKEGLGEFPAQVPHLGKGGLGGVPSGIPLLNKEGLGEVPGVSRGKIARTALYALGVLIFLPAIALIASLPAGVALIDLTTRFGPFHGILFSPVVAAGFAIMLMAEIAIIKRLIAGHVSPGRYQVNSLFHLRKWFVDAMMQMALELLHPLYATIYLPPWFRMLGAKLGRRVEISTVAHITPELLSIGAESFIADSACMGATRVHKGWLTMESTSIGRRTFIGNSALVPSGSQIGNESLIGVLSTPPSNDVLDENPGTSWLGSPPVRLPNRQSSGSFPDEVTFNPPWHLYLIRGAIEFFRVTMPTALMMFVIAAVIHGSVALSHAVSLPILIAALPAVYIGACLIAIGIVVGIKWAVMGKYRPCTKPLWSSFVWRTEMVTAIHESFCAPMLLNLLQGTPFLAWYFRAMGSRIGKRVCMETTQITEFDLVNVGDDAELNLNCTIQTHLFEDRVMKCSNLHVGPKCSVGPMAVVLYDSEMQEGASLSGLSLLMKGENLPAWTKWHGIPAQRNQAL
jgi:amino acid adenylation domain-containing protein